METVRMDTPYNPPILEVLEVKIEKGFASSGIPERNPVGWN